MLRTVGWLDRLRDRSNKDAGAPDPGPSAPEAGFPAAPPLSSEDGDLRAVEVHRAALPFGEELVTARGQSTSVVLDAADAELLRGAWPYRPLEVHARALARRANVDADEAERRLRRLAERGLLHGLGAARAGLEASASAEPEAPLPRIASLSVVTRDRTALLSRLLADHRRVAAAHGRAVEQVICDDSARVEVRAQHRALPGVRYAGLEEKQAYLDRLAARVPDVPRALLAFAMGLEGRVLSGSSVGANHTVGILDAAGTCVLSVDDDTTARTALAPPATGLAVTGAHDATVFRFHADRDAAIAAAAWGDVDPLALHETMLGHAVGALVAARAGQPLDLDGASAALVRRLARGQVRVTSLGVVGDSGMGSPGYYLLLGEPSRASLFADYALHRRTRAVTRMVQRATVSAGTFLMAPSVGLDARTLLPPFFPYGRNQDGAYAVALRTLLPDAYLGHLPAAVEHLPGEARRFGEDADRAAMGTALLADVLIHALELAPSGHGLYVDGRFHQVGAHLARLGGLPPRELTELLTVERAGRVAGQVGRLQAAADAPPEGAPEAWLADVERAIEHLRAVATEAERVLPVGWVKELGAEGAAARAGEVLRLHGRLLEAWPRVFEAAKQLRSEQGGRVSV